MPRIVNKEEKRQQIVMAAMAVFARQGYHNSRIADIAKESGIGKGTVYEYFSKKEDIVSSVFDALFAQYAAQAEALTDSEAPPLEVIVGFLMSTLESLHEYAELVLVYLEMYSSKFLDETLGIRGQLGEMLDKMSRALVPLIKEGQKTGVINPDIKPYPLARSLLAAFDGFAFHYSLFPPEKTFFKNQLIEMERMTRAVLQSHKIQ